MSSGPHLVQEVVHQHGMMKHGGAVQGRHALGVLQLQDPHLLEDHTVETELFQVLTNESIIDCPSPSAAVGCNYGTLNVEPSASRHHDPADLVASRESRRSRGIT